MLDEHSEFSTFRKVGALLGALTSKPLVLRSLEWAAIFVAIDLLLHPTVVTRILHQNNYLGVFAVVALLFGLSVAKLTERVFFRTREPSTIEASEFVLKHAGRVIGRFGHDDGLATLTLVNPDGTEKVFLSTRGLALLDGEDNHRAAIGMTDSGPRLTLTNDAGDRFAQLEVSQGGPNLTLGLLDEEEVIRQSVSLALENAGPMIVILAEGKGVTRLSVRSLDVINLESKSYVSVTAAGSASIDMRGSQPSIQMQDGDGKVVWKAPISA